MIPTNLPPIDGTKLTIYQRTGANRLLKMLLDEDQKAEFAKIDKEYTDPQLIDAIRQRLGPQTEYWVGDQAEKYERELEEEVNAYHDEPNELDRNGRPIFGE